MVPYAAFAAVFLLFGIGISAFTSLTVTALDDRDAVHAQRDPNLTSMGAWARVDVTMRLDVGVLYDPDGNRTLWIGVGNWTFAEGSSSTAGSRALVENYSHSARARFVRTGGAPVTISGHDSLEDAQTRTNSLLQVESSFAHTYATITLRARADHYLVTVDDQIAFTVAAADGSILLHDRGEWRAPPADAPLTVTIPDADVLVEDDCRIAPNADYECTRDPG